ncbi:hypothetical protein [Nostoc sp.]
MLVETMPLLIETMPLLVETIALLTETMRLQEVALDSVAMQLLNRKML